MAVAGRSDGCDLGMEDEIMGNGGSAFGIRGGGSEVIDGGAYVVEVAKEVLRDMDRDRGRRFGRLEG